MVRKGGFEPPWSCDRQPLKLSRKVGRRAPVTTGFAQIPTRRSVPRRHGVPMRVPRCVTFNLKVEGQGTWRGPLGDAHPLRVALLLK